MRHRRWLLSSLVLLALFGCLVGAPTVARADDLPRVIGQDVQVTFGQAIEFTLDVESTQPIDEIVLFYGLTAEPLVRRIYPTFAPGTSVHVDYTEQLESGQYAPGAEFQWWWEVVPATGEALRSETQYFVYADERFSWQILQGQGVQVHWYGNKSDGTRAQAILTQAEQALDRLQQEMGAATERDVNVYVYNSQRDMAPALTTRSNAYDDLILTLGVAVDQTTLLLLGNQTDVMLTTSHELSHIVVGIATDNPYVSLPRWLDEGLAMYAQGELPRDNQQALDQAVKDDALLSVRSMTSYSGLAEQVDLFYGEVYSLIDFMLSTYGRDRMQSLLGGFAQGLPQEQALQNAYGLSLTELDNLWRQSLGLGPRRTETAPTPAALRPPEPARSQGSASAGELGLLVFALPVAFGTRPGALGGR